MRETDPSLKAHAKAQDAEILWADETAARPEAHRRRSFAPKGEAPVVRQPTQRFHRSIIRFINDRKRKILLIVDHWRVYDAKRVKEWPQENKHRIKVHDLPSYNPELNSGVSRTNERE